SLAVDQFGRAVAVVVRHGLGGAAVEHGKFAATVSAGGQALQQRGAFADRAGPGLAAFGADVLVDACLVGLVGVPVDEPAMVIGDDDLPLVSRQLTSPRPQLAVVRDVAVHACSA